MIRFVAISRLMFGSARVTRFAIAIDTVNFSPLSR